MDFLVREAVLADYPGLCEVLAQVVILHATLVPAVFRPVDGPARSREYIASILSNEQALLLVAEQAGCVLGVLHAYLSTTPDIPFLVPHCYATVDTLVVREDARRSGIGRALMEYVHRWALGQGAREVELNVWEENRGAIAFYEALGYTTARRRMVCALDP